MNHLKCNNCFKIKIHQLFFLIFVASSFVLSACKKDLQSSNLPTAQEDALRPINPSCKLQTELQDGFLFRTFQYDNAGRISKIIESNIEWEEYWRHFDFTYNAQGNISSYWIRDNWTPWLVTLQYQGNSNLPVKEVVSVPSTNRVISTTIFQYTQQGRLVKGSRENGENVFEINYAPNGNVLSYIRTYSPIDQVRWDYQYAGLVKDPWTAVNGFQNQIMVPVLVRGVILRSLPSRVVESYKSEDGSWVAIDGYNNRYETGNGNYATKTFTTFDSWPVEEFLVNEWSLSCGNSSVNKPGNFGLSTKNKQTSQSLLNEMEREAVHIAITQNRQLAEVENEIAPKYFKALKQHSKAK